MKKEELLICLAIVGIIFGFLIPGNSEGQNKPAEHPGEHPGIEKNPAGQIAPQDVRNAISDYIKKDAELKGGYFLIYDNVEKKAWALQLNKVHDRISFIKKENAYFACCDFAEVCNDCMTGKEHDMTAHHKIDIDFWMKNSGRNFDVYRILIHKTDGKERHIYKDDEIVTLK